MLLPSALSCDMYSANQIQKPQRPKLQSFAAYEAPLSSLRTGPSGLIASCRALQSILGGPLQALQSPTGELPTTRPIPRSNPFESKQRLRSPTRVVAPSRGANKRSRVDYEEDLSAHFDDLQTAVEERNEYLTPKRQRIIPLDTSLGLEASDFDSLETPTFSREPTPMDQDIPIDIPDSRQILMDGMSSLPTAPTDDMKEDQPVQLSSEEDRHLLEAVLGKMNLTMRDWNDCATQLGKDKDTLGRRWRMLLGDGSTGLRRGTGPMSRTELDINSW